MDTTARFRTYTNMLRGPRHDQAERQGLAAPAARTSPRLRQRNSRRCVQPTLNLGSSHSKPEDERVPFVVGADRRVQRRSSSSWRRPAFGSRRRWRPDGKRKREFGSGSGKARRSGPSVSQSSGPGSTARCPRCRPESSLPAARLARRGGIDPSLRRPGDRACSAANRLLAGHDRSVLEHEGGDRVGAGQLGAAVTRRSFSTGT